MNANEIIDRAERYCFPGHAAHIRSEIEAAQRRIVSANATPARKQAERAYKRLLIEIKTLEREFEDDKYQADGARARAEYDAQRNAEAFARGADYQTEMRQASRVQYLYGAQP